ncbi:MAG: 23S rRNA (pseudouridine(1915)-N(3))-methyltransferase RlmH [Defluviitaleaceae bacterium]|nr:23S rRNA (pseudouridine(1915)-N(3))-methyltransferase RlmH [Defluviitaleaceae bacterium]
MKITVISVGKIKDRYLQLGIDEFKKRLSRFCKLELIEVKDEPLIEKASEKDLEIVRQKEGELILNKLSANTHVIAMDINGQRLSSEQFAHKMKAIGTYGQSHITFIIGGSVGIADQIKQRADIKMSFSEMTFPHQLFKLMLLEQVYRAFKINANETYHK